MADRRNHHVDLLNGVDQTLVVIQIAMDDFDSLRLEMVDDLGLGSRAWIHAPERRSRVLPWCFPPL